ncbi:MAG: TIGR04282 family arsenosugar biosynthesis glycosyltransferase [Chloroflexia bacterium]
MPGLLIIMAKRPSLGLVKTRFSPPLRPEDALALYEAFLSDTIRLVLAACAQAPGITPALAYSPSDALDHFAQLVPPGFLLLPQQGDDLGERLASLPRQAAALGFGPVAMLNSDSPTLPPPYVVGCFTELARSDVDVVLGPCTDGGYYLVGVKAPQNAIFTGIGWSTGQAMDDTIAAAAEAGLRVALLPAWYDADTAGDLLLLKTHVEKYPRLAPATRAAMAALPPGTLDGVTRS